MSIPPADHARLARIADASYLSLNSVMVHAVQLFLKEAAKEEGYVLRLRDPEVKETPGGQQPS